MSNTRLPSFKFLIGFEAAARLGNYSRAAEELFVSQSAVSHQISQLEQQVGQPLFRRKGRGVELTVAGSLLLDSVGKSLEHIRNGLARIETYMDDRLVTLVCPAPVANGWLQPRVDRLLQAHPDLCPIISVDESARFIDELDVDIAITRVPLRQEGVFEVPLLTDELVAVGPATSTDDAALGLLCLEDDLTSDRIGPFIRAHFGGRRKAAIYDDPRLVLDAALRGRGIALVSRLLADDALRTGQLRLLADSPRLPLGSLWISRAEGPSRLPLVRGVFDSLLQFAQEDAQNMRQIDQSVENTSIV
ncbi:LysR family transcriptional regulator [Acidovorax cavernicola]|uniref:LysR family transcriptional regulator n=1 Tax=Acidovorax cavernicola TaxID=1675792 RepID=A0A9X8D760_9BURK|nr:LysR family transcriptional regulator [Acidovorax cavernicola]RIX81678.1 LysR family transcriptional regulator [Acidovorax cavernicola]